MVFLVISLKVFHKNITKKKVLILNFLELSFYSMDDETMNGWVVTRVAQTFVYSFPSSSKPSCSPNSLYGTTFSQTTPTLVGPGTRGKVWDAVQVSFKVVSPKLSEVKDLFVYYNYRS